MNLETKGRNLLLVIGIFAITCDILYSTFWVLKLFSYQQAALSGSIITNSIFRILTEIALLVFCYKGHAWAKWILCIILIFISVFLLLQFTSGATDFNPIVALISSILFLLGGAILFTSPAIKAFMMSQQER